MSRAAAPRKGLLAEIARLTPEEQLLAERLARSVWEYIGADVMRAVAESGSKRSSIPRAEVVEVVLDADRYREEIEREIRRAERNDRFENKTESEQRLARLKNLKAWFAYQGDRGADGAASYAAQCALVGRAFAAREG